MKEIRRQIAAANDIDLVVAECHYKGDCPGTCPKCEAEVRELEQALERRRLAGKAVSLLGISAGLLATAPGGDALAQEREAVVRDTTEEQDGARYFVEAAGSVDGRSQICFSRVVVDEEGKPLEGVTATYEMYSLNETQTDEKGRLILLLIDEGIMIELSAPGRETLCFYAHEGLWRVPIVLRKERLKEGRKKGQRDTLVLVEQYVKDEAGEPLAGAAVRVKGKKAVRALTGSDGMFSLRVPKGTELEVSYVGLEPERFTVGREMPEMDLVLKEEPALMGEMEVAEVVQPAPVIKRDTFFAGGIQVRKIPEGSVMVQGVVVDGEGQPLRGAEILQFGKGKEELVDRTDEAGRFGAPVVLRRKRFKVAKEGYRARVVKAVEDEEKGFLWLRVVLEREER